MSWRVIRDNCLVAMAAMDACSVDAIVCDPPYSLEFMGKEWDSHETPLAYQEWCVAWAKEGLRVLKPGGHLLAFGGTRTYHRLASGIEDAGFEIRDSVVWLYGQGFPKSLNVSLAIDKAAGVEREVVGRNPNHRDSEAAKVVQARWNDATMTGDLTAPATPDAERWDGWGTALKPGHEPVVVARKPLDGTVAANVLAHGTGALNIDGCRIGNNPVQINRLASWSGFGQEIKPDYEATRSHGRWPANVCFTHTEDCVRVGERRVKPTNGSGIASTLSRGVAKDGYVGGTEREGHDSLGGHVDEDGSELVEDWKCVPGCPVAALDAQSGVLVSGTAVGGLHRKSNKTANCYGEYVGKRDEGDVTYGDSGGASRFFYCAKTSRTERNAGLTRAELRANIHPTVKPIELMRWLVRLVMPAGGVLLDPFVGSGTTGCAAVLEGFDFIGVERSAEYVPIAEARIAWWADHPEDVTLAQRLDAESVRGERDATGQTNLFEGISE